MAAQIISHHNLNQTTNNSSLAQASTTPNAMGDGGEMLFEIMNPLARGIDRLFNEEDRMKLRDISSQINDFLEDLTAEENDIKNGYISRS
jgi:hypothetical protein